MPGTLRMLRRTCHSNCCTSGRVRSSTSWLRCSSSSRFGCAITQSECCSNNSLWGLTISGSIQIPNLRPRLAASAASSARPSGKRLRLGCQSPRPARSFTRGYLLPNQPSSNRNSSVPSSLAGLYRPTMRLKSKSKPVAYQLFNSTVLAA